MNTEELNALKDRAYKTAVAHGFHEEVKSDAYYLGLVMSEAGEAINADRKGQHAATFFYTLDTEKGLPFKNSFEWYIKDSMEDEIADIVIRLLDFAGMKGYELDIASIDHVVSNHALLAFSVYELPGMLFTIIGTLSDAFDEGILGSCVSMTINIISDCFGKMTGSDKDLWWFVEKKMAYNELRPRLNGKKY